MVEGVYRRRLKRALDLGLSGVAATVLSPLMIAVATLVRLEDGGPVIFSQDRVGKEGRIFKFHKFRSMPVETENVSSDKAGGLKMTRIGRIIRRTNIDELPQLFNIMKGEMSIVGPRPPIPSQTELVELRRESGALCCVPGLTGLAQVRSFDGMSVAQKARFDQEYSDHINFLGDMKIIIETLGYLLKPPPVY